MSVYGEFLLTVDTAFSSSCASQDEPDPPFRLSSSSSREPLKGEQDGGRHDTRAPN
jgi:hypothetical protein